MHVGCAFWTLNSFLVKSGLSSFSETEGWPLSSSPASALTLPKESEALVAAEAAPTAQDSQGTQTQPLQKPEAESAEPKPGQELAVPEVKEFCCTCKREVDAENSVVLVRQSTKGGASTRRCRSCHAVRAAIGRLQKNHGKLVESFHHGLNNDKDKRTAFYTQWPHLRGSALQAKLEEHVEQWQKESTKVSFTGTGVFLDEEDMRAKYANKPTQLASILENTYQFHDHIRNCKLYEDVAFKREVSDCVETGKKRNFKHQGLLQTSQTDPAVAGEEPSSSRERAKSNGKPAPEAPKLKKGKKLEAVASKRLMCLDYLEKSSKYQDMVPAYVLTATRQAVTEGSTQLDGWRAAVDSGHAQLGFPCHLFVSLFVNKMNPPTELSITTRHASTILEEADNLFATLSEAAARIKTQVDQAVAYQQK